MSDHYHFGVAGYEVSTAGDARYSAMVAKMDDGRTVEMHYQCDVKGYQPGGTDWRLGKGKAALAEVGPSTTSDLFYAYVDLWRKWAAAHLDEMRQLRFYADLHGRALHDKFAKTVVNQADALAHLLNEGYGQ